MRVTGIIVTKGDVDLAPCTETWPAEWDHFAWNNSLVEDQSVFGRYRAIKHTTTDLIYVQDDDVIVSEPQLLVDAWQWHYDHLTEGDDGFVVCNMPPQYRPHYDDAALVGFGAVFQRDAPARAFERLGLGPSDPLLLRECDRAFTVLTPRVLVDVPIEHRDFASNPDRLWKQPGHHAATRQMLELAREARDQ